ncbi:MAG: 50S ribosomal protein L11 methyltransferase [Alicyclobacillaceae bacterium]|nr:50S ribosomal protein L11 methyltransferase [Alicyclobacillaceae bacterium]
MRWWEVRFEVPAEASEAVCALVQEWPEVTGVAVEGCAGDKPVHPEWGEWFDESLLHTSVQQVSFYVPDYVPSSAVADRLRRDLERVRAAGLDVGQAEERWTLRLVDESEWENAWKDHFRPIPVGRRLMVVPSWERDTWHEQVSGADRERIAVVIEPGMAFGTGTHPTTQLCLEALEALVFPGARVLDVGCGTAILSVAAARLGAGRVVAVDIDPVAVSVATRNVADNGLSDVIEVCQGDLLSGVAGEPFDLVVANILRDAVVGLAPQLPGRLAPGGRALVSGFVVAQEPAVVAALAAQGMAVDAQWRCADWVALAAVMRR